MVDTSRARLLRIRVVPIRTSESAMMYVGLSIRSPIVRAPTTIRWSAPYLVAASAALVASGCSDGYDALGTHTAAVSINGTELEKRLPVRSEQIRRHWYIETLKENPGFTAQIQMADSAIARGVQIERLGGFTGSFWDGTVGTADAAIADGTVRVSGMAEDYYHRDPAEGATAEFLIRTDC